MKEYHSRGFKRKLDSKTDERGVVESKSANNAGLECLGLSHDSSRSLRGHKARLWTKRYVLFVEKGNIDKRRSEKGFGTQLKMAMQVWTLKNILAGTDIRIRFPLGENRK